MIAGALLLIASVAVGLLIGAAARDGGGASSSAPGDLSGLPGAAASGTRFSAAAAQRLPKGSSVIATARAAALRVHRRPAAASPARTVRARRGIPLVVLVKRRREGWIEAYLPTRPNRSTGWIRTRVVMLAATPYRIEVRLGSHRLLVFRRGRAIVRAPIATGRAVSPTPTGRYFVTDLLRPPDPHGFYGPYALGLSAHSPVYTTFEGGDGQIGLHGTDQPSVLGTDVSHGCIRVANRTITRIARLVPLGSPVDITRG